jgi:hypothetical protein
MSTETIEALMKSGYDSILHSGGFQMNPDRVFHNVLAMLDPKKLISSFTNIGKADGGLISQYNIPKFEKGINMVPANMLAMLHKNEAVVPANMNPFNPNAQSYSQPSISYNIAPVINAAPGMDEQAIANMATRQVLAEIKLIDARNNASMGRPGTRVVGK